MICGLIHCVRVRSLKLIRIRERCWLQLVVEQLWRISSLVQIGEQLTQILIATLRCCQMGLHLLIMSVLSMRLWLLVAIRLELIHFKIGCHLLFCIKSKVGELVKTHRNWLRSSWSRWGWIIKSAWLWKLAHEELLVDWMEEFILIKVLAILRWPTKWYLLILWGRLSFWFHRYTFYRWWW